MNHCAQFLAETAKIAAHIDPLQIEELVKELVALRERKGRLFLLGLGGSAANCSHAVNDFRKLCDVDAFTPSDNVAELTARANDEGWENTFRDWLEASHINDKDALFVLSVGGGHAEVSLPITNALMSVYRKRIDAPKTRIFGIVGKTGGMTKIYGDCVIVIPTVNGSRVTPHTEGWQSVILHCLVSHPNLQVNKTKW